MKKVFYFSILSLFACSKSSDKPAEQYGTVIFYTLNVAAHNQYEAVVDNKSIGLIPYTAVEPPCSDENIYLGLHVKLSTGWHTVYFKSLQGYAGSGTQQFYVGEGCQTYN